MTAITDTACKRIESFKPELLRAMETARPERTYEKGHVFPISIPDRFKEADERIIDWRTVGEIQNPLRLYVHIPWCKSRCLFCFYESNLGIPSEDSVDTYLLALGKELELYSRRIGRKKLETETLYIGGGTPSILTPKQVDKLFDVLRAHVQFRLGAFLITESSPGTLTKEKVDAFKRNGVNRMSLGVQTLDDKILKFCRRDHDAEGAKRAYQLIREGNMPEVNIDLMLALPNQSYESFQQTLEGALQLSPSSISFLDLRICPGSNLFKNLAKFSVHIPSWKDDLVMRAIYQEMMKSSDYQRTRPHYYVKPDEMRHRATRVPCLDSRVDLGFQIGLGTSAYSHLEDVAFINASGEDYIKFLSEGKLPIMKASVLSEADKTAMRAIRTIIDTTTVPNRTDVTKQYGDQIKYLQTNGLLLEDFELTDDGCLFGEEVVYSFYPKGNNSGDLADFEVGWWQERYKGNQEAMTKQLARFFMMHYDLPFTKARTAAELKVKATEHHDSAKRAYQLMDKESIHNANAEWHNARDLLKRHFEIIYSK
jgi:oxygen-independent coproporphyrinogen-3 oxidase